ncbi:hypothetical protein [Streptomyces sp. Inha503]|uniref:hypothetical protein n=1 Tax=Streptomyces sp. Inha503 TaxID=3383314 RepID=UPI0039A3B959
MTDQTTGFVNEVDRRLGDPLRVLELSPTRLDHVQSPFGLDAITYLPFDVTGVLMDAETQHLAHFLLREDPALYGLTDEAAINARLVGVEVYHDIDLVAARQIFHDRNLLGVIPNKNVALASDSSNLATNITLTLLKEVEVAGPSENGRIPGTSSGVASSVCRRRRESCARRSGVVAVGGSSTVCWISFKRSSARWVSSRRSLRRCNR